MSHNNLKIGTIPDVIDGASYLPIVHSPYTALVLCKASTLHTYIYGLTDQQIESTNRHWKIGRYSTKANSQ